MRTKNSQAPKRKPLWRNTAILFGVATAGFVVAAILTGGISILAFAIFGALFGARLAYVAYAKHQENIQMNMKANRTDSQRNIYSEPNRDPTFMTISPEAQAISKISMQKSRLEWQLERERKLNTWMVKKGVSTDYISKLEEVDKKSISAQEKTAEKNSIRDEYMASFEKDEAAKAEQYEKDFKAWIKETDQETQYANAQDSVEYYEERGGWISQDGDSIYLKPFYDAFDRSRQQVQDSRTAQVRQSDNATSSSLGSNTGGGQNNNKLQVEQLML